jgi:hypothetical protein
MPAQHTARVIPFRRPGAANDADLAASLDAFTRREGVIGALRLAAQAPRRGSRPAKVRDGDLRSVEAIRREQVAAWLEALVEVAEHGPTADLLGAMRALILAMDGRLRDRAQARLDAIQDGHPVEDVAELRRQLRLMGNGGAPPPSGPRPLLAGDPRYVAARRAALDALGALCGDLAPGVTRLGGVALSPEDTRDLADMVRELNVEAAFPSRGNIPRMARQAAEQVHALTASDALRARASVAVRALLDLAVMVERVGAR